jgi:hypothetical protein
MTCDSALAVCGVHSIGQVLDQQLTRPKKEPEEEEGNIFGCTQSTTSGQTVHVPI